MAVESQALNLGRLFGRHCLIRGLAFLRTRAASFKISIFGEQHLSPLLGQSFLIVSNHVRAASTEFWPLAHTYYFKQYHHSADSFIYYRVVQEQTGTALNTVAICGAAWLSPRRWRAWLQQHAGQPFARGQMEADPRYIAVEKLPGTCQRPFLKSIERAVERLEPILIFPGATEAVGSGEGLFSGAAHIAQKHKLMILPACVIGSESWQKGNRVTVAFGEPFTADGLCKQDINHEIYGRINALVDLYQPCHTTFVQHSVPDRSSRRSGIRECSAGHAGDEDNVAPV